MLKETHKTLIVWIVAILSIFAFYSSILVSPNSVLFRTDGDAMKNYYVYKYYIDKNESMVDFNGMNYPYGEIVMFLDAQPPVAFVIKAVSEVFPGIKRIDLAIMHYLIFLSFVISIVFFYKIFHYLKLSFYFSVIGSLSIVLLAPQFARIMGHYSLSFTFFFPLVIYYLLNNNKYSNIIIGLAVTVAFFMHPYIGLSLFMLVSLFNLQKLILDKKKEIKKIIIGEIFQAIIPITVFVVVLTILDNHIHRSTNPSGLYYYHSSINTILTPMFEPMHSLYSFVFDTGGQFMERMSYIGVVSNLVLIFLIFISIKAIVKRTKINLPINKDIWKLFFASIVLLLFSFGLPHVYLIPQILDLLPNLRQFRGLARFAWSFYFILAIIAFVLINYFYSKNKENKKWAFVFLLLPLIFLAEAIMYQFSITNQVGNDKNEFDINQVDYYPEVLEKIDPDNYQAILPIPFYHIGSEDHKILGSGASVKNSMLLSYHLELPILGSLGSRTSVDEVKKSVSVLLPQFYQKPIEQDIDSEKDFLIIKSKGFLEKTERDILSQASLLMENDLFILYSFSPQQMFEYKKYKNNILNNFLTINDSVHLKNSFILSDTTKYFKYISFDGEKSQHIRSGSGARELDKTQSHVIFEINEGELDSKKEYVLSFWYYNKGYGRTNHQMMWEECETTTNKCNWKHVNDARFSKIVVGDWSLIEYNFSPPNQTTKYSLYFPERDNGVDSIYIDDLLLRESDLNIYKAINNNKKGQLFYNSHLIDTDIDFSILASNRECMFEYYKKLIDSNMDWEESIRKKALANNKSFEDELKVNIAYMINERGYEITYPIDLKIIFYKKLIYLNKSWLGELKIQAHTKGLSVDSIVGLNAKYMAERN